MAEVAHVWLKSNERRFSEVKEAPQFSRGLYLYSLCIVTKWSHNMCLKASSSVARAQDFLSWILDSAKQHSPLQILSCSEHRKLTPTQRVPIGTTSCFILESSEQETVGIFREGISFPLALPQQLYSSSLPESKFFLKDQTVPQEAAFCLLSKAPSQQPERKGWHKPHWGEGRGLGPVLSVSCVESECTFPLKQC